LKERAPAPVLINDTSFFIHDYIDVYSSTREDFEVFNSMEEITLSYTINLLDKLFGASSVLTRYYEDENFESKPHRSNFKI